MKPARKDRCCPICGRPNHCGEAEAGEPKGSCWCYGKHFPPELLARVPSSYRRSPCICPDCLAEALAKWRPPMRSTAKCAKRAS